MKRIMIINKLLIVVSIIINTIYLVLTLLNKIEFNIWPIISYYILVIIILVLKKIKINFTPVVELIYIVFIILSCLMGSVIKLYDLIYWYDSLVHYLSGIVSSIVGFMILKEFKIFDYKKIKFNILFIIMTTLSIAALWELFEFSADIFLGGDMQKVLTTGINDTMKDIICALLGSILVCICFGYECINNKKMIIVKFINSEK